ncbi:hypothetical protein GGS26DRAFT_535784, partial [Hypomontagnella submonticulosa]
MRYAIDVTQCESHHILVSFLFFNEILVLLELVASANSTYSMLRWTLLGVRKTCFIGFFYCYIPA